MFLCTIFFVLSPVFIETLWRKNSKVYAFFVMVPYAIDSIFVNNTEDEDEVMIEVIIIIIIIITRGYWARGPVGDPIPHSDLVRG